MANGNMRNAQGLPFIFGEGKRQSSGAIKSFDLGAAGARVADLIPVLRGLLQPETQLRQGYQGANIAEMGTFLRGLIPLSRQSGISAARQLSDIRERELRGMRGDTGLARGILYGISPEAAAQVRASTEAAQRAEQAAMGLTGQEMRDVQQQAREAAASAGRLGGNAAIASELLGRDAMLGQKRLEAAQARQQAYSMGQQFYGLPGLSLLTSQPVSTGAASNLLQYGAGAIGRGRPQLLDPSTGVNLSLAQLNALTGLESQYMAKNAQERAANMAFAGDIIKGATNMFSPIKIPGLT